MIIKLSKLKYKKLIKELNNIGCGFNHWGLDSCDSVSSCYNHNTINKIKKLLKIKDKNER